MERKIYLIIPLKIKRSWELPFYLYGNCISKLLSCNGINHQLLDRKSIINVNSNDIIIQFQPYFSSYNCKIILINTESLTIKPNIHKQIENPNIKMIWDYQLKNIHLTKKNSFYVPPLYHEFYEEHFGENKLEKTIDFLFYGRLNERRKKIIDKLSIKYNVLCINENDYRELYDKIKRSRIVLIINSYDNNNCIDFYRLSLLLSNKIFVINEECQDEEKYIWKFFKNKIIVSSYKDFYNNCVKYITMSQSERDEISKETYEIFKRNLRLDKFLPLKEINELYNSSTNIR